MMRRKQILYLLFSAALGLSVDFTHFFGSLLPSVAAQAAAKPAAIEMVAPAYDSTLSD